MSLMNQDYALSRWREDRAKDDPEPYSTKTLRGRLFMWLTIGGNEGWHAPEMQDGKLVGLRSSAWSPILDSESPEDRKSLNYAFKLVGVMQRAKIEKVLA